MSVVEHGLVVTGDIFGETDLTIKGVVKGSVYFTKRQFTH
jgi:cytoskeletal protein CcmA (bactofilin family)